jgi:hypothetical protein
MSEARVRVSLSDGVLEFEGNGAKLYLYGLQVLKQRDTARLAGLDLRLFGTHIRRGTKQDIDTVTIAGDVIVGDLDAPGDCPPTSSITFARPKSSTFTTPSGRDCTGGTEERSGLRRASAPRGVTASGPSSS